MPFTRNPNAMYTVCTPPESDSLQGREGFGSNCFPINDEVGESMFGHNAYFVNTNWLTKQMFNNHNFNNKQ